MISNYQRALDLADHIAEVDETPRELVKQLHQYGLLAPDLPAPYKPRAWQAGIADVRRINPRADEVEKMEIIVFHSNGRIYCSKEQARSLACALLAAANHAEAQANE